MSDNTNAPKAAAPEVAEAAEQAKLWILEVVIAAHRRSPAQTKIAVEVLEAFIDLLAAAPQQVAAWMPISTAPKDGTWILLAGPDHTGAQRMVCRWTNFLEWESADDGYGAYIRPTNWQPLPALPSQASATGEV